MGERDRARAYNRAFRRARLCLQSDAIAAMDEFFVKYGEQSIDAFVEDILNKFEEGGCAPADNIVTATTLRPVLDILAKPAGGDQDDAFAASGARIRVLSAIEAPRVHWDHSRSVFVVDRSHTPHYHSPDPKSKWQRLESRYHVLRQRLLRDASFHRDALARGPQSSSEELASIESVAGTSGTVSLFGLLAELEEGRFYLEDPGASIQLDLSRCKTSVGVFLEHCFVIVIGELDKDDVFCVKYMGFPPPESRDTTLSAFDDLQFAAPEDRVRLRKLEEAHAGADSVVLFSECHLDRPDVLDRIDLILSQRSPTFPSLFVFCGNFSSTPIGDDYGRQRALFDALAAVIERHEALAMDSLFVFVPGPADLSYGRSLPHPGLPALVTERLRQSIRNVMFPSNPCRIQYCTQEIVVFRDDICRRLIETCALPPNLEAETSLHRHVVKTLLDQAHLCPVHPTRQPVHWDLDHGLRLYPMPTMLVLADDAPAYESTYTACYVFNPGSFAHDFSYAAYMPGRRVVEFSNVDDND
ncbi:unnamed protein product (mitochondrion) [Plasmodiophora brassicae]|uniref:DNA polymerase epsilon subunit n=1 Tax=Plasmodiophora brassicae TaxID=37360 RepID=A0A3P3YL63_PLABS|nr:unnamed protein product [Plasmodiophora brassicae]